MDGDSLTPPARVSESSLGKNARGCEAAAGAGKSGANAVLLCGGL